MEDNSQTKTNNSTEEKQTTACETVCENSKEEGTLTSLLGLTDEQVDFAQEKTIEFAIPGSKLNEAIENIQNAISERFPDMSETHKARLLALSTLALGKAMVAMRNPMLSLLAMLDEKE